MVTRSQVRVAVRFTAADRTQAVSALPVYSVNRGQIPVSDAVHADSVLAWGYLVPHGSVELYGRDEALDEAVRRRLRPLAANLLQAFADSALGESVAALLDSGVGPYVQVTEDIVDLGAQHIVLSPNGLPSLIAAGLQPFCPVNRNERFGLSDRVREAGRPVDADAKVLDILEHVVITDPQREVVVRPPGPITVGSAIRDEHLPATPCAAASIVRR